MADDIQKLKDELGRLQRKKHDYSTVLATMFNNNTAMQEEFVRRLKIFNSILLEIKTLSSAGKLDNEHVHRITVRAIEEINNE
jgi:hypothetical protein